MFNHFKSFLLTILLASATVQIHAQVGIGTTNVNASAKLQVDATDKGFLPPRVTLTSGTDNTTIASPATGLLVYNTGNNAGLAAGYYYWNGNAWATIATAGGSGSVAAEYGEVNLTNGSTISNTIADLAGSTINLPSAGTWKITYFVYYSIATLNQFGVALYDASNNLIANSGSMSDGYVTNGPFGVLTNIATVTISNPAVYKLRGSTDIGTATIRNTYTSGTSNSGNSKIFYEKISGNAPMSVINYGDVKTGIQSGDHNGWIKLDGRFKSTLSATQQAQATTLGIGTNLPNATNAFLVQNGGTLGAVTGSSSKTIDQSNLPNVTLSGTAASAGAHTHTISFSSTAQTQIWSITSTSGGNAGYNQSANETTSSSGAHTHAVTTSSLNGGVTQTTLDVTPKSLTVNTFIYLGY